MTTAEFIRRTPEQAFQAASESLKKGAEMYLAPSWIENKGEYWTTRTDARTGLQVPYFYPDAYDPRRPHIPKGKAYILESNPEWVLEDPFDLDNLRIMDKQKVVALGARLEELVKDPSEKGKYITALIGTGGTIAMHEEIEQGEKKLVAGLDVDELLRKTGQGITDDFAVASIQFPTLIDSSQMEIDYNAELVIAMSWIWKNASEQLKQRFAGFVVAHGTDTMAGSSAYLATMLGPNCPFSVGVVGAQKTTHDKPTDAFANVKLVFDSIYKLKQDDITERFVAMGGTSGGAYPAVGVRKISDRMVLAMAALGYPNIMDVSDFTEGGINTPFQEEYKRAITAGWSQMNPQLNYMLDFFPVILRGYSHILPIEPQEGHDPEIYTNMIRGDHLGRFIVLTTFGAFTANNKIRKAIIEAAKDTGKEILAANPFPEGRTDHAYEPAVELRKSGVHVTAIPPIALGAKILLGERLFGQNRRGVIDFVTKRNYVGEQPPLYWNAFSQDEAVSSDAYIGLGLPRNQFNILYSGKVTA